MEKPITLTVTSAQTRAEIRDTITAGDSDAYPLSITFSDLTAITGTVRFRFVRGDDYWDRDATVAGNVASLMLEPAFYAATGTELWVSFEDSNLYTPLHVYFRDIRVPGGNVEASTSQTYPEWAAEMRELDVSIGTVTTLAEGADATASITGTIPDKVLNLGIPVGATGGKGDAATLAVGTVTTLDAGESATVANSGTSGAAVLDFGLPQGAKGDKGDPGDPGLDGSAVPIDDASTAADRVLSASYIKGQLSDVDAQLLAIDAEVDSVEENLYTSSNLINTDKLTIGLALNSSGIIISNSSYAITDFMEVDPNRSYASLRILRYVHYDENKNKISVSNMASLTVPQTFKTPVNARYIRGTGEHITKHLMQLNKGSSFLNYEEYYARIKKEYLTEHRHYLIPETLVGWYEAPFVEYGYSAVDHYSDTVSLENIYSVYDSMVTNNPNYVTKTELGNDSTDTYPVYKYVFSPEDVSATLLTKDLPTVLIFTGLHGEEKTSVISMRNFMSDVCENWGSNSILEYIRWNIKIIIIPIVNPYGFVNRTRKNGNGVDINRNFDWRWSESTSTDPSSSTYKGTSVFSEMESQYIRDLLESNRNAVCALDYHMNGSSGSEYSTMFWHNISTVNNSENLELMNVVSKHSIRKLTLESQSRYDIPNNSGWIGFISYTQAEPLLMNYISSLGVPGATIECTRKIVGEATVYSDKTLQLCTEFIGNTICNIIKSWQQ